MKAKTPVTNEGLEEIIEKVLKEAKTHQADSPEFAKCVDQLDKLYKMRNSEKKTEPAVHRDSWISAGSNLVGILAILGFESAGHAIGSKALSFVTKSRI